MNWSRPLVSGAEESILLAYDKHKPAPPAAIRGRVNPVVCPVSSKACASALALDAAQAINTGAERRFLLKRAVPGNAHPLDICVSLTRWHWCIRTRSSTCHRPYPSPCCGAQKTLDTSVAQDPCGGEVAGRRECPDVGGLTFGPLFDLHRGDVEQNQLWPRRSS